MSVFFTPTNLATLHVLAHNGCEVHIPPGQGCCGALAVHAGDRAGGREMARHLIDQFEALAVDSIVVNAAGCGSTLKEYGHLLADDPEYAVRAERFAGMVKDVSELLAELPIVFPNGENSEREPLRVTYHDACHLAHGQKVRQPPREILERMPGIELTPLEESDWCCGSAGTYNLTQPDMAGKLLRRKVNNLLNTGAEVVVTGNPGCNLQIARGLRDVGSSMRVMHTIDLIASAYPEPVPGLPWPDRARERQPERG